ncbi:NADH-quinone oxidoreductase subunit NuoE family protein [Solidesulfovibrio carbinolicus]|uniref:NAD(P)H-dependent oxidoreductase subunit E n=1 Tax=Solidesulfovibrio carbinolicus TaxID=296842 RepID=A0A4P6HND4_9BACT|nr:NAD(P)H-dependent oxidoreductase subunit E [Solidesulfovibrio carbinolicus]QAZ68753.1 NAD(P)H-dependent oxidoreductase subunit E [Solidesulfovibrio carbinolicus]
MEPCLAPALAETAKFEKLCGILDRYDRHPARLVPILQALQEEYRYLPQEVLSYVATSLRIPEANVFGVATFYAHFALEPKGKYVVRLCDGTACHVKQSIPILEALRARLDLTEAKATTPDMLFTVETVACLGACGLAPVLVINEDVYGQMTPQRAVDLIDAIRAKELQ